MTNFIIIAICLVAGMFIRRRAKLARHDVRLLNIVVLWLSLPAVILVEVPKLFREVSISGELLLAVAMPWLQFAGAVALAIYFRKKTNASLALAGGLGLTAGLGNTSFVGFPIIEALHGSAGLRYAILIDQLGSFLVVGTLGLVFASMCAGRDVKPRAIVRRVVFFPPFIAFCFATVWGFSSVPTDGIMTDALRRLGGTLVPLALFSVGWQLELSKASFGHYWKPLTLGLGFKLILWPIVVAFALRSLTETDSIFYKVTVLESAMAPMITAAVVASEFDLEGDFAQMMVGIGIPLSFLTISIWHFALTHWL